jgi:hypothetical protein
MSQPTTSPISGLQIFYKDSGAGQPVVFSHGSPVLLISHVTGCAWTIHPIEAR